MENKYPTSVNSPKSREDEVIINCSLVQRHLLDDIEKHLTQFGKDETIEYIRALKDSLK